MTEHDRARLERASQHPTYAEAMQRPPQDYAVPVALVALFYMIVPVLFFVPLFATGGTTDTVFAVIFFVSSVLPAIPFLIGVTRTWPLRSLPPRHVFGLITEQLPGRRGRWVRVEGLDGNSAELALRLKAYLESTGGAVAPGSVGVALCKGDQMVDWVAIPDVVAEPVS